MALAGYPLPDRIASMADQVQEWAVEELFSIGRPTNWPQCPRPSRFPSAIRGRAGEPGGLELSQNGRHRDRDRTAIQPAAIALQPPAPDGRHPKFRGYRYR